jgi:hypothetical protein
VRETSNIEHRTLNIETLAGGIHNRSSAFGVQRSAFSSLALDVVVTFVAFAFSGRQAAWAVVLHANSALRIPRRSSRHLRRGFRAPRASQNLMEVRRVFF